IDIAAFGRVRLLGIDAPELGRGFDTSAPFAREARDRLNALVFRRWVRLEQEGQTLDIYSRHLAYVFTEDGVFVNETLVRDGLARVSARVPLLHLAELQRAESDARAFRRGMWGTAPDVSAPRYTPPSPGRRIPPSRRRKSTGRIPRADGRRSRRVRLTTEN